MKKFSKALAISLFACAVFILIRLLSHRVTFLLESYYIFFKYGFVIALAFFLAKPTLRGTGYSKKEAFILGLAICFSLHIFTIILFPFLIIMGEIPSLLEFSRYLINQFLIFLEPKWWIGNIWIIPIVFFTLTKKEVIIKDDFF